MSQNKEKETSNTDSLPLDILVDLKGTDNTVVTDPIVKDEVTMIEKIKDGETFYSGSFNFTKKDLLKKMMISLKKRVIRELKYFS